MEVKRKSAYKPYVGRPRRISHTYLAPGNGIDVLFVQFYMCYQRHGELLYIIAPNWVNYIGFQCAQWETTTVKLNYT